MDRLSYDTQSCVQLSLLSGLRRLFRYWPIERPFYKFDGIDCCPKLNAKLVNRLFHRRRQVPPPINSVAHRFFGGCYHLIDGDIAVGLRHSLFLSLGRRRDQMFAGTAAALCAHNNMRYLAFVMAQKQTVQSHRLASALPPEVPD